MEQAQQVKPLLPKKSLWPDHDEEDDEEEVGVGLLARHSSHPTNGVEATSSSSSSSTTTTTTSDELEPTPVSALAPVNGTSSKHSDQEEEKEKQEEEEEEEEEATAGGSRRNEEVGDENEEDKVVKGESDGNGNSVYFDKPQGTESFNEISEMHSEIPKIPSVEINLEQMKKVEDQQFFGVSPAPVEQLHGETNTSSKHFHNAMKVDSNVDLIGEIEEDLMELDVERVLEKQNTHDLYCPKCNSCITRKVILVRRKPKINIRHKTKRVKNLDPIPNSGGDGLNGDTPETYSNVGPTPAPFSNVGPTPAPGEQNNGREQEQEAFSCLSCFSLFIPIGNGCFKIFQFFRQGRQNEHIQSSQEISQSENTESPQEICQRENTQSPQGINPSENTQSPREINWQEKTQSPQGIIQNENPETLQKVSDNEDTQSPQKRSHDEKTHSPQHINHNEEAKNPQNISRNEDTQSPQKISSNYNTQSLLDINQNESKQSPQNIPTARKKWNFSIFAFHKGKATVEKGGDEIEDIEAGVHDPTFSPRTELAPLTQSRTQNECGGADVGEANEWEILKSIVYGGLVESITSLGVVSSAAGAGAGTLNILALGLANLIGGLLVIIHNLIELKNDKPRGGSSEINVEEDRYQTVLGQRKNFVLHVTLAILSFLIFGLVPPVVYGFSFRKSDDKDFKLAAVAGASLVCIILLALGKGHVRKPHSAYFRTVSYYVVMGITASGISYAVGELINKLVDRLGLFESSSAVSMPFLETIPLEVGRASY
ncbi:hypothetical protein REPUB_Repub08aG0150600 [Reevesia pubescens]